MGSTYSLAKIGKNRRISKCLMSGKDKDPEKYSTISGLANNISVSPKDFGINTVQLSVLEIMSEKARALVRNDKLVLEKPGATNSFYIVAGSATHVFCVSYGKGWPFKFDRNCNNSRTKIWQYVIGVVEKCGKLQQFTHWFSPSKRRAFASPLL